MDGAEPASPTIDAGRDFVYRFSLPHPGTYWAHPHTGLDADTGLYLPVIVDDPAEPGAYDAEWIVVLDDWTDGVGKTPQQKLCRPARPTHACHGHHARNGHAGHGTGVGTSGLLGGDPGDLKYPHYLINGRIPAAPTTFTARAGARIRIRIINAGSDTAFRVALTGHSMTVTHTDGYPVIPIDVDALLLGMGERYDVTVTAADGVFPLVALAEGKNGVARAVLSTGAGTLPARDFEPAELTGRLGTVETFTATPAVDLGSAKPDAELSAELAGSMSNYTWTINGVPFAQAHRFLCAWDSGQR